VERVEVVANDGRTGDRGNEWGGHQVRHTVHNDGTERIIYVKGDLNGSLRTWRLMKRSPSTGAWAQEAAGQTDNEAMLVRDPATDSAHVITFPASVATIATAPSFAPITMSTGWGSLSSVYKSAGIGSDGTLVVKDFLDHANPLTANTDLKYISGKWNGSSWGFNSVVTKSVGERYCYDYILPGAFGNSSEFVDVSTRDVTKDVAGLPNLTASYVWDGVRSQKSGVSSVSGWSVFDVMPKLTQPSTTLTVAAWMALQDVFADSNKRLFTLHRAPTAVGGSTTMFLTVNDSAGNRLYQGIPSYTAGHMRIFEDGKGRLWVLGFTLGSNPVVRLYKLNADFTFGPYTDLSSKFAGYGYSGYSHLAVSRGGNVIGNTLSGSYPNGTQTVAFRIRLPD
jgi:hypothetical protein